MCQINSMHRVVQYRAECHAYQEILPCTIPPCALNFKLSDIPNLLAYMQIRKCHFFLQCMPPITRITDRIARHTAQLNTHVHTNKTEKLTVTDKLVLYICLSIASTADTLYRRSGFNCEFFYVSQLIDSQT